MFDFDKTTGEIFIYDAIGPAWLGMIDAETVLSAIKDYPKERKLTLRLNSPGGSVDQAIAIYNALERHKGGVDVSIDSLAASAASYLATVGQRVTIAENGGIMVHSPMLGMAFGNAVQLRKLADSLDKYEERVLGAYMRRYKKTDEEMRQILAEETWYTAKEAVELGLADEIANITVEPVAVYAGMFEKTPQQFLVKREAGEMTKYDYKRERAAAVAKRHRALL